MAHKHIDKLTDNWINIYRYTRKCAHANTHTHTHRGQEMLTILLQGTHSIEKPALTARFVELSYALPYDKL